jgi:hypothetical protein
MYRISSSCFPAQHLLLAFQYTGRLNLKVYLNAVFNLSMVALAVCLFTPNVPVIPQFFGR